MSEKMELAIFWTNTINYTYAKNYTKTHNFILPF